MQARRQALVLHSIEGDIGQVALPRDRVAWAVLAAIRSIGQVHSPNPFVKDDLEDGSDRRVLAGGHWPALVRVKLEAFQSSSCSSEPRKVQVEMIGLR